MMLPQQQRRIYVISRVKKSLQKALILGADINNQRLGEDIINLCMEEEHVTRKTAIEYLAAAKASINITKQDIQHLL